MCLLAPCVFFELCPECCDFAVCLFSHTWRKDHVCRVSAKSGPLRSNIFFGSARTYARIAHTHTHVHKVDVERRLLNSEAVEWDNKRCPYNLKGPGNYTDHSLTNCIFGVKSPSKVPENFTRKSYEDNGYPQNALTRALPTNTYMNRNTFKVKTCL